MDCLSLIIGLYLIFNKSLFMSKTGSTINYRSVPVAFGL